MSKDDYVKGVIRVEDPSRHFSDQEVFEAPMRIKGRGNTTWGMPKKPYRIKLDEKASIFSLGKDKDWVLLANYSDKTLMRNIAAMELSRICGMKWTPVMICVDVYFNDEYIGVYVFTEHKKVSSSRVDIEVAGDKDNDGEALTGGYYLEIEEAMDETTCFLSSHGTPFMFQDPSFVREVKERWRELYPQICKVPEFVDTQIELLGGAQQRNFERWDILDKYVWPNAVWLGSYQAEVDYFYDYYNRRVKWLDKSINAL